MPLHGVQTYAVESTGKWTVGQNLHQCTNNEIKAKFPLLGILEIPETIMILSAESDFECLHALTYHRNTFGFR